VEDGTLELVEPNNGAAVVVDGTEAPNNGVAVVEDGAVEPNNGAAVVVNGVFPNKGVAEFPNTDEDVDSVPPNIPAVIYD